MSLKRQVKYEEDRDPLFADGIKQLIDAKNLGRCIQCGTCSAACPLSIYMDYTPRRIINLARAGFKKEVLSSLTIWLCSSCYACYVECPKEIHITEIMYILKRKAIEEGVYPHSFPIPVLAKEFAKMVFLFGRVNETLLAADVFLRTNWFRFISMTGLGLNLIRTGRMSPLPDSIKAKAQLRAMLKTKENPK